MTAPFTTSVEVVWDGTIRVLPSAPLLDPKGQEQAYWEHLQWREVSEAILVEAKLFFPS
jgi:hypothetical protein